VLHDFAVLIADLFRRRLWHSPCDPRLVSLLIPQSLRIEPDSDDRIEELQELL
jgi:hypothetical protein